MLPILIALIFLIIQSNQQPIQIPDIVVDDEIIQEVEKPKIDEDKKQEEPPKVVPSSQSIPTPPSQTPNPEPQPEPEPTLLHYTSIMEYEPTIMGLCPSERPASDFPYQGVLPAIGIATVGMNSKDLKDMVALFWGKAYMDPAWYSRPVSVGNITQFGYGKQHLSFYLTYPSLEVYYDNTFAEKDILPQVKVEHPELIQTLDAKASEMTSYVRSIDRQYKAKCPND